MQRDDLIFLLRHGEIEAAGGKKFIGTTDILLKETGIDQANYWKSSFMGFDLSGIYASALERCRYTAAIIAENRSFMIEPCLNEIHLGSWENKEFDLIREQFPEEFTLRGLQLDTFCPPGGESFQDLSDRVLPFFQRCLSESGSRLIVTHAGIMRVLLCHINRIPLKHLFRIQLSYAQLFIIEK